MMFQIHVHLIPPCTLERMLCRYYEKPRLPVHRSENLEKAFRFMTEEEKLHLVNIGKCPMYVWLANLQDCYATYL